MMFLFQISTGQDYINLIAELETHDVVPPFFLIVAVMLENFRENFENAMDTTITEEDMLHLRDQWYEKEGYTADDAPSSINLYDARSLGLEAKGDFAAIRT